MKCINKKIIIFSIFSLCLFCMASLAGCKKSSLPMPYSLEQNTLSGEAQSRKMAPLFGEDLCVAGAGDTDNPQVDLSKAEGAGLFCLEDKSVIYGKNIHGRLYPASTTKILTAIVALKYGNLQDRVTISQNAVDLEPGAATCNIAPGDVLTLEQLLYGLLLNSGNDAAIAIAEHISGSVEAFVKLMNGEAAKLGATNSHFVNPHGLHDENHYSTVYDLYLLCNAALSYEKFVEIIGKASYTAQYQRADGGQGQVEFVSTNQYYKGVEAPAQATVLGGKTGTTDEAGSCLVLASQDRAGKRYISVVLKAGDRDALYAGMNTLLGLVP